MRIRALKPGFFRNEQLAELSPWHRLCYEGLWCCADREGRMQDRPKRLKADIFPYDDLNFDHLLWDLARAGFIRRYVIGSQPLIWIPTWHEHQHPRLDEAPSVLSAYVDGSDRTTAQVLEPSTVPPIETTPSLSSDRPPTPARMGQVEVGSGTSGSGTLDVGDGSSGADRAGARAADVMELWNTTTNAPIPKCRELTDERRRKIRARLAKRPLLTEWRTVFERIQASAFCRGETDRGWRADFDWVMRNDTIPARVLEGKYDDRAGPSHLSAVGRGNLSAMEAAARRIAAHD